MQAFFSREPDREAGALRVQRAVADLRGGREVRLDDGSDAPGLRLIAAEANRGLLPRGFVGTDGRARLLVSAQRAEILGHAGDAPAVELALSTDGLPPPGISRALAALAGRSATPWLAGTDVPFRASDVHAPLAPAALALARAASLLPALVWCPEEARSAGTATPSRVTAADVADYPEACGRLLELASSASVPLEGAGPCEFAVYRERFGESEHVAVVIGEPDRDEPVTVRIHSACFTGDLFGSLKCDCGEQLRGAVAGLAAEGGGVILYLAQEGRGLGLANKLRAYSMQARGTDTIDADRALGFGPDGRDFTVAHTMLADLGIARVRLVTNNPRKIRALEAGGIEVVERVPSVASVNPHNAYYLETKRDRAGHLLAPGALAVGAK